MNTFLDFLKKYSSISNTFLEDFFNLYNRNTSDNDFVIDLKNVAKWLKVNLKVLRETLKKSYTKNIDYIDNSNKIQKKGSGGHTLKITLLTPNCFKKICQLTKSKKGDEVREYFIKVEETLFRYKNYIIEGLEEKIKKLEQNQKPKVYPKRGVIYVFETPNSPQNSLYKIGKTKDLKQRLKSHQSPLSHDINILYYFETEDIDSVEKCAKTFMKKYQYRKYKEVYQVNIDIIKEVISSCGKIPENIKLKENKDNKYFMHISNDNV
jgi:phage anti-repressor protein